MTAAPVEQLPIRTIASLTGVKAVTLRAWERRYGLLQPLRTPKGHRLYTHEHLQLIRRVQAMVQRGVPISRVRAQFEAETAPEQAARNHGPWHSYLERMSEAIARFDEPDLDRVYDEALSVHPVQRVTARLLLPLLERLGARWKDLSGAVAEEHFFATYLRSKLGARLQHLVRYASGPRLVAACAPGEQHEIGLMLLALHASAVGLRTVLLGADTPLDDMVIAQFRSGARAVVISSSLDPAPGMLERALPSLVQRSTVPVFVGGATAVRHRHAIAAAGAIPIGVDIEEGVRRIEMTLGHERIGT
jgi:MerR family transcriptional regulator, light-induced transcriptional regulator